MPFQRNFDCFFDAKIEPRTFASCSVRSGCGTLFFSSSAGISSFFACNVKTTKMTHEETRNLTAKHYWNVPWCRFQWVPAHFWLLFLPSLRHVWFFCFKMLIQNKNIHPLVDHGSCYIFVTCVLSGLGLALCLRVSLSLWFGLSLCRGLGSHGKSGVDASLVASLEASQLPLRCQNEASNVGVTKSKEFDIPIPKIRM